MVAFKDLTGKRFGIITVVKVSHNHKGRWQWHCRCDCGRTSVKTATEIGRLCPTAPGCRRCSRFKNLAGERHGRLVVVEIADDRWASRRIHWLCRCDCGNTAVISALCLKKKSCTLSCGCLLADINKKRRKYHPGAREMKEYKVWCEMKQRCASHNGTEYKNYGARGITVCTEWVESFEDFLQHVGRRPSAWHSLDRIDNNGNYEPGNVRWATREVQNNNRRNCRILTCNGRTMTITQWARELGIGEGTLFLRLKRGWTTDRALQTRKVVPVRTSTIKTRRYQTSPERRCWRGIIGRCHRRHFHSYDYYGGRGIQVCRRWRKSFEAFLEDMGPRPSEAYSLDRINNDGNYSPSNCRWATRIEQASNKRNNHKLTCNGVTHTIAEWARIGNISHAAIIARLKAGWPVERAVGPRTRHVN